MVESLLLEMLNIVFAEDFDLAPKVIVGAFDQLVFTSLLMFVQVLSLDFLPAFIIAFNDLEEASFIVLMKIFVDYDCVAFLVRTIYSPEIASQLMRFNLLSLLPNCTSLFEQALSFVRTVNSLKRTVNIDVVF